MRVVQREIIRIALVCVAILFLVLCFIFFGKVRAQDSTVQAKRFKPELVVQTGHKGEILTTVFSPDGRFLVTGGSDTTIKLWDIQTGEELHSFSYYRVLGEVRSLAFSPDGKLLASGGRFGSVDLIGLLDGRGLGVGMHHSGAVNTVAFSPDGKMIASGGEDQTTRIWDVATSKELQRFGEFKPFSLTPDGKFPSNPQAVKAVAFNPHLDIVASAGTDAKIRLWNPKDGTLINTLVGHTSPINTLLFTPDGKRLISADENEIKIWSVNNGELLKGFKPVKKILSLAMNPNGKRLAVVGTDNDFKIISLDGNNEPISITTPTGIFLRTVAFSPDGDTFATTETVPDRLMVTTGGKIGSTDPEIRLWSARTAKDIKVLTGSANNIYSMSLSPDGKKLAVADRDSTVRIWDSDKTNPVQTTKIERSGAPSLIFSPDSGSLVVGSWGGTKILDSVTGSVIAKFDDLKLGTLGRRLAISPDGKAMALSGETDLSLRDVKTGALIRKFGQYSQQGEKIQPTEIAIDPTGTFLAGGGEDGVTHIWDINTGEERLTCAQNKPVTAIAFSPDGKFLVTITNSGLKVCSVSDPKLQAAAPNTGLARYLTFSPDSKYTATITASGLVGFLDVSSGKPSIFTGSAGHAKYTPGFLAFSPSGKLLFSANSDTKIDIWNVETRKLVATLVTIGDNDWAVVTPDGLFDASDGAQALMHFVVNDPQTGYETISLNQLKHFWVPGLLKKVFNGEPLPSEGEFAVTLFPDVQIEQAKPDEALLKVNLKNRGGGIGRIEVRVNGSELTPDARAGKSIDPHAPDVVLPVEIPKARLRSGNNEIDFIAWNLEGDVQSRSHKFFLNMADNGLVSRGAGFVDNKANKPPSQIDYYAIISGISNYSGDALNLRYAAKDAEDMARAFTVAARRYFCADEMAANKPCTRVHIRLLGTETNKDAQFGGLPDIPDFQRFDPVKGNYEKAFADVAKNAKADDVVTVYFSGHATSITTDEAVRESAIADTYLYATREATTLDRAVLANETERKTKTVSSLELAKWLSDINAQKKVLVLDTCAAGAVQKDLVAQVRDVDALQTKSIDRLRARTGFYVLMGSAANAQSFEANEYRQGLLTYSLLEGMTINGKLRDGRFLDVEKWFGGAADRVEELAKGIGGVQRPFYFKSYSAGSFDIGRVDDDERKLIPLASRVPLILEPFIFEKTDSNDIIDTEGLTEKLETRLLEQSLVYARGTVAPINYINASRAANGISPRGFYTISGDQLTVEVSLSRDKKPLAKIKVVGTRKEVIEKLIQEILRALPIEG